MIWNQVTINLGLYKNSTAMHMVYMISYGAKTMVFVVKMNNLTSINEMVHIQDLPITMGCYEVLIECTVRFIFNL